MSVTIYREEITDLGHCEQFEVETRGELKYMPRKARMVYAIFGCFERTPNGTLLYTSHVPEDWTEYNKDRKDLLDSLDSEYLDDLQALKLGNVEIVEEVRA